MGLLPRKFCFLQCQAVRGEGGDSAFFGMKEKEPERSEMIEWQISEERRGLLSVFGSQQGGDDQSAAEGWPIRWAGL
jgi:hypothetical protein